LDSTAESSIEEPRERARTARSKEQTPKEQKKAEQQGVEQKSKGSREKGAAKGRRKGAKEQSTVCPFCSVTLFLDLPLCSLSSV